MAANRFFLCLPCYCFVFFINVLTIVLILTLTSSGTPTVIDCYFATPNSTTCEILDELTNETSIKSIDRVVKAFILKQPSQLNAIPKIIFEFPDLSRIEFNSAKIATLTFGDFSFASNLINLQLIDNNVEIVPQKTLDSATKLEELNFNFNRIHTIEDYAFQNLSHLRSLSLAYNKLTNLTEFTFYGAINLEFLNLEHNEIALIVDGALKLLKLQTLLMSFNELSAINNDLCAATPSIKDLHLSYNKISSIDNIIRTCTELNSLQADNNSIASLDLESLSKLKNIIAISLENNQIHFPNNIASKTSTNSPLNRINLSANNLSNPNIFNILSIFSNLKAIQLNNNGFHSLNASASTLLLLFPHLESIELNDNSEIRQWFEENQNNKINFRFR